MGGGIGSLSKLKLRTILNISGDGKLSRRNFRTARRRGLIPLIARAVSPAAPYNEAMLRLWIILGMTWVAGMSTACVTNLDLESDTPLIADDPIVVGRAVTLLTGPTNRWYGPEVRFIELINRGTGQRYHVTVESDDRQFVVGLPAGEYEVNRVQISEGPFMSLAYLHETFVVHPEQINYVGTWRFAVDMPKYGRQLLVSIIEDLNDRSEAAHRFVEQHPEWSDRSISTVLPEPLTLESRLYEVAPYPRIHRYFRRQW
jgi:hypothetical protein